jgi:response regulator NasT
VAHILIVEDDRLVLTGLANGLEALGYVASKASSGEQALEILDTVKPDLVVMDACLVKPITVNQLVPAIESALARAGDIAKLKELEENLATALARSREISIAIGMLMERYNISAEDAFEILRAHARTTRRRVSDVAQDFLAGSLQLESTAKAGPKNR